MSDNNIIDLAENLVNISFDTPKMLNVPSSAIHIKNDISLIQKKLWFELVYHAFPSMGDRKKYSISLNRLREVLGWSDSTSSDNRLKEALRGLSQTVIEWNIFGKDRKRVWECFSMLSGCQIPEKSGICIFEFSSFLEDRFLAMGQEAYVKIDLIISKKFQSKYALSMYCLALDYLMVENGYSEKKFSIEELRQYFAVKPNEYNFIADFNKRVILPTEEEINKISDINIEIKPFKEGRKIAGYKLCMSLKPGIAKDYLEKRNRFKQLAESSDISESLVNQISKTKSVPKINIESEILKKFFSENSISLTTDIVQKRLAELENEIDNLEDYLTFLMNYSKKESKKGNIKNFSGFFIGLLKDSIQMDNYLFYQEQQKQIHIERDKITNKHIKNKLNEIYEQYLSNDFQSFILNNANLLEDKIMRYIYEKIVPGTFAYDVIIKKYMNDEFSIDKFLKLQKFHQLPIINELKNNQNNFGYQIMAYGEWESANQELIQSLKNNTVNILF